MPFKLSIKAKEPYLIIKITGFISTFDEQKAMDKAKVEKMIKYNVDKVIFDDTEIQHAPNLFKVVDISNLVKFYIDKLPIKFKFHKIVDVLNQSFKSMPDYLELARFWETYARNRGFDVKIVYSMEDALKYFQNKKKEPQQTIVKNF